MKKGTDISTLSDEDMVVLLSSVSNLSDEDISSIIERLKGCPRLISHIFHIANKELEKKFVPILIETLDKYTTFSGYIPSDIDMAKLMTSDPKLSIDVLDNLVMGMVGYETDMLKGAIAVFDGFNDNVDIMLVSASTKKDIEKVKRILRGLRAYSEDLYNTRLPRTLSMKMLTE